MKAIGSGMATGLEQVEFLHIEWNDIQVKVGGEILKEWRCWISELGNGHCVSCTTFVIFFQQEILFKFHRCGWKTKQTNK